MEKKKDKTDCSLYNYQLQGHNSTQQVGCSSKMSAQSQSSIYQFNLQSCLALIGFSVILWRVAHLKKKKNQAMYT